MVCVLLLVGFLNWFLFVSFVSSHWTKLLGYIGWFSRIFRREMNRTWLITSFICLLVFHHSWTIILGYWFNIILIKFRGQRDFMDASCRRFYERGFILRWWFIVNLYILNLWRIDNVWFVFTLHKFFEQLCIFRCLHINWVVWSH